MDEQSTKWIEHHNKTNPTRRAALGMLLSAAALPPVIGTLPAEAQVTAPSRRRQAAATQLTDALRRTQMPGLTFRQVAQITGSRHRVTFHEATWDTGSTYVRDLEVKLPDGTWLLTTDDQHRFDEQWVVFTGEFPGGPFYYYGPTTPHWIAFDSLQQVGTRTVELKATDDTFDLTVRWNLDGANPELQYALTAKRDDHYIVGYQAFDAIQDSSAEEVLCGALQHARVIGPAAALSAWELFAPMALVEQRRGAGSTSVTTGVYIPADVIAFEHERALGSDRQPFGMSLRNDSDDVTTAVYAPQAGPRAAMKQGDRRGYAFGLCALPTKLYEAYEDLCRKEYGYTAYRENVYDSSLTDAIHNIVDLLAIDPPGDDSTSFQPSFSGWWSRAKGFIDVENDQAVRTPVSGVLLSAHNLTSPPNSEQDFYQARARHLIEYQLSRKGIGYTPIKGKGVYGDLTQYRVGKVPGDAATLAPLYLQTRAQNAGIHKLAMDVLLADRQGDHRTPVSVPLAGYLLTNDPAFLAEAKTTALRYIRDEIDTPYTTNVSESSFGYRYSKGWTELLVLFELTHDERFLAGAHKEVRRFVTQTEVRPVPDETITVPIPPVGDSQFQWPTPPGALPDYPTDEVTPQTVPAWYVSTSGLTFEQLTTFKIGTSATENPGGGFVFNPCWVPFLLRLAHYTNDSLLNDIAHNMVVGRFTNYPGYYSRQYQVDQLKPDYPLQGPPGITGVYFHHAPGQLGLAIDYLISEQFVRSGGEIAFPSVFESNYVYFKYSVYGHEPGTFYGETGVWPYFPKGLVNVDNPAVNWFAGVGNGSLYVSLTNASARPQQVTVDVATALTGVREGSRITLAYARDKRFGKPQRLSGTATTVTVPAHGIAAFVVRGVTIDVPWHSSVPGADRATSSYHFEDTDPATDFGLASGLLLVRPDRSGYDAYVSIDTEQASTLRYRIGDGPTQETPAKPFPYEWTIGVDGLTQVFSYQIVSGSLTTNEITLRLPASVTGAVDGVGGELTCPPTTTPGDKVTLTARLRNGTSTAMSGVNVAVTVPTGWTIAPAGTPVTSVPANATADAHFTVTLPATANLATHPLSATLTWNGGTADLDATSILVRQPRKLTSLTAPVSIAKPGDQATVTATVLNSGPQALNAELKLTPPAGWTVAAPTVQLNVPARSELRHEFQATSPAAAVPGNLYRFSATVTGANTKALNIKVNDAGIIVTNLDYWPKYVETGEWLGSSLAGWNGIQSRYSAPEVIGGTATWQPELPQAGEYDVAVWYPSNFQTTTSAAYIVTHAGGSDEVVVNQMENANSWRRLGRFRFEQGSTGKVRLEVRNTLFHRVSAAQFVFVSP